MRKNLYFLLFMILLCTAVLCGCACEHEVAVMDAAVAPTCSAEGLTEGSHCSECGEILVAQTAVEKLAHTPVTDWGTSATCAKAGKTKGSHCSVCGEVIVAQTVIEPLEHRLITDKAVPATCTSSGKTEGSRCFVCGEVFKEQEVIDPLPHTVVVDAGVAATCTSAGKTEGSHCSKCGEVFTEQKTIAKLAHKVVTDAAVAATCTTAGKTEGSHCAWCGTVFVAQKIKPAHTDTLDILEPAARPSCTRWGATGHFRCSVCKTTLHEQQYLEPAEHSYQNGTCTVCGLEKIDYTDISIYASDAGYRYFETAPKGDAMRKLYDEIMAGLTEFHSNPNMNAWYVQNTESHGNLYGIGNYDYTKHGLTYDDALTVLYLVRKDQPAFYWMVYGACGNAKTIMPVTRAEYAKGADRVKYNEILYEGVEEYVSLAEGETSVYNIALIYYDAILEKNSYAYDDAGVPQNALWAHSVIGSFLHGELVCEGYTKLFQLLLRASGVESLYVSGQVKEGAHAWNLVRLDDGNWYWFDLTWGDVNTNPYKYFGAIDGVMHTHTPSAPNEKGIGVNPPLPASAASPFRSDDVPLIGETFTSGGTTYKRISSDTVQFISGKWTGAKKMVHNGVVYLIA